MTRVSGCEHLTVQPTVRRVISLSDVAGQTQERTGVLADVISLIHVGGADDRDRKLQQSLAPE